MSSLNKVMLIGNAGRDPEIRHTSAGNKVASFSLATSESWKDKSTGARHERTEWHRISVFNDGLIGVIEKYVRKGTKLYLSGKLQTRKWTDQQGQEKYTTEIVLGPYGCELLLLGGKSDGQDSGGAQADPVPTDVGDDEIPF